MIQPKFLANRRLRFCPYPASLLLLKYTAAPIIITPPRIANTPSLSFNTITPKIVPTSGSIFKNTPARDAGTHASPQFQNAYAIAVANTPCAIAAVHTCFEKLNRRCSVARNHTTTISVPNPIIITVTYSAPYSRIRCLVSSIITTAAISDTTTSASPSADARGPFAPLLDAAISTAPTPESPSISHSTDFSRSCKKITELSASIIGSVPTISADDAGAELGDFFARAAKVGG